MTPRCCHPYCNDEATLHITKGAAGQPASEARYRGLSFCSQEHMAETLTAEYRLLEDDSPFVPALRAQS